MFALLYDLQLMAESNCTIRRSPTIRKDVLVAAEAIYRAMYAKDDKFPATFKVLSFIGWKPGQNMPKPVKRGSQNVSLKVVFVFFWYKMSCSGPEQDCGESGAGRVPKQE